MAVIIFVAVVLGVFFFLGAAKSGGTSGKPTQTTRKPAPKKPTSTATRKPTASTKKPASVARKPVSTTTRKPAPAAKKPAGKEFNPPSEFDFVYHLLMRFASALYARSLSVDISGYARDCDGHKAGEITLTLTSYESIEWRKESLRRDDGSSNKGVYQMFYGPNYRGETIRYQFREPDCYIFGCPEGPFRNEVQEYCPHAYVDFYRHYDNGYFYASIKFSEISDQKVYENGKEFDRWLNVVFGI